MHLNFDSEVPIYLQIAQAIEDDILKDIFMAGEQIPSTTEISVSYKINPATVAKGVSLLVDEGIIYKKRGVGMFVHKEAKDKLIGKRKEGFYNNYIVSLLDEAKKINIGLEEIISMLKRGEE